MGPPGPSPCYGTGHQNSLTGIKHLQRDGQAFSQTLKTGRPEFTFSRKRMRD